MSIYIDAHVCIAHVSTQYEAITCGFGEGGFLEAVAAGGWGLEASLAQRSSMCEVARTAATSRGWRGRGAQHGTVEQMGRSHHAGL